MLALLVLVLVALEAAALEIDDEELLLERLEEMLDVELELEELLELELEEAVEDELLLEEELKAALALEDEPDPVGVAGGGLVGLLLVLPPDGPPPLPPPPPQATSAAQSPIRLACASLTRKRVFGLLIICLPRIFL